jgi:glutamine synthetase
MNLLAKHLKKKQEDFTRFDIIRYMDEHQIRMLNFRYVGGDGRLKTLNFVIHSTEHLEELLTLGERVDGSSLFSYVDAASSDLYVLPRFSTAFLNPFSAEPAIDILCNFFTAEGEPLANSPENLVRKAHIALKEETGYGMEALGELEFYIMSDIDPIYGITPQKGYHESHPFSKWEMIRLECMKYMDDVGCLVKYGHAEVGNILHEGTEMVQHEIEFLPRPLEEAADQIVIAKWIVREVAYKYGLTVSFAPKIILGHAGSGLHIHSRLMKDGVNAMVDEKGNLSSACRALIGGYLMSAASLSAFANRVPTSYLRLVPHQEAPTDICWGDRNRSTLVRVPLGWRGTGNMIGKANPNEPDTKKQWTNRQTVELRSPDGSAQAHYLLAGMAMAALEGLTSPETEQVVKSGYVEVDVHKTDSSDLPQLPTSCFEAANALDRQREIYERNQVFPKAFVDSLIQNLKEYNDLNLSERYFGDEKVLKNLVEQYIHCG